MEVTDSKFGGTEYPMIDMEASSSEWGLEKKRALCSRCRAWCQQPCHLDLMHDRLWC